MRLEHGSLRAECFVVILLLIFGCCSCQRGPFARHCLYLDEGVGPWDACGPGQDVRLRFCDSYEPARLFRKGAPCDAGALDRLRTLDARARDAACRFATLLDRYDCENANSVSWTCKDCQEAYKQWVCAMFLPELQVEGEEALKPCRYICRMVEQRCPYFHPSVKDQYAGERVFKCIDPDIPDLESIHAVSSYGPPHRCYCPQHLGAAPLLTKGQQQEDAECRLLTPAQLRRNASRHRSGGAAAPLTPPAPPLLLLLPAALLMALWTRTR